MDIITTATSVDEANRGATVAVLPVGSFEQHGAHLPLSTDTLIASLIASRLAKAYDLLLLPPITISCSHEHAHFPGTVSVSAATLHGMVNDIAHSLEKRGVTQLVLVNAHGGNYVLSNIVQEANVLTPRMGLFPLRDDWDRAREAAGLETNSHEDMHGGEAETSILLCSAPEVVQPTWESADHEAPNRNELLLLGVDAYSKSGIIGRPSAASKAKGYALLDELTALFQSQFAILQGSSENI